MSDLASRITSVFEAVPRPEPGELLHPECRDPNPVAPFEAFDRWQEVPHDVLCRDYDALSFFSARAFRFFAPAFMLAALDLFRTSTAYVSDAIVFELNPHSEYARSRFVLFTRPECEVVAEFLELMARSPEDADAPTAQAALDGFWYQAARGAV